MLPPDAEEPDPAYREALGWVWSFSSRSRDPDQQQWARARKVERMRALLDALGGPERAYPNLLVAGTKGKGSTTAMLAAGLAAPGRRVARYTSPHLLNWRERACINGVPIGTDEVLALVPAVRAACDALDPALGPLSTFEVGTALALLHFARVGVDVAVLEVGVGGQTDATNLAHPLVSVITPVSMDHVATLGPTLEDIARHKAGVMRAGRVTVSGPQSPVVARVLAEVAEQRGATLERVGVDWTWQPAEGAQVCDGPLVVERSGDPSTRREVHLRLLGRHQRDNATAAIAALEELGRAEPRLRVSAASVQAGLARVRWPGRLDVVARQPLVVLDGAHNGASAEALAAALADCFRYERLVLVVGLSAGKDLEGVLRPLAPLAAEIIVTRSRHERAADPTHVLTLAGSLAPGARTTARASVAEALDLALMRATPRDLVLATGSLFVVGEALAWSGQRR